MHTSACKVRVGCDHCGETHGLDLTNASLTSFLRCVHCGNLITCVDVSSEGDWIESQVVRKRRLAERGQLGTRKQSRRQSDSDIDRDGLSAELAACTILCPLAFEKWRRSAEGMSDNRGRDLLRTWTGLDRPVEVKHTRYHDDERGFLIVRPPRHAPGRMRAEYIEDAYYVLLTGEPFQHTMLGWIDRTGLLQDGRLNPVPVRTGQRESWGVHWSKLRPLEPLAERAGHGGRLGALRRWLADWLA